ncbi:MAG: NifB/NifX family molybdenum-iron cluster-binding protein [Peptococcaceae bacterium]|nr:NifB/NifX family molybdenum-iron cluster-binding protein [Peptococcaceae bacterium]
MKIAISSSGQTLDADLDPRFGRCPYYIILDTDTDSYDVIVNNAASGSGGAGIQAAETVSHYGVRAVFTGQIGPNAYRVLAAAGIDCYTGCRGTIQDVVRSYQSGELQPTTKPTSPGHTGMGKKGRF